MLHQALSLHDAHCAMARSADLVPVLDGKTPSCPDPAIRRHPDGSIDYAHYDRIARDLHAHDLRTALKAVISPFQWLFGGLRLQLSSPARPIFGPKL